MGSVVISVTVTDADGATATGTVTVTQGPAPSAPPLLQLGGIPAGPAFQQTPYFVPLG